MQAEFRRCLEECDVAGIKRLWAHVGGHLPQPHSDDEALITLHRARTEAGTLALKLRAYSHRWLLDHGYPSGLPDGLKPKAERMYPRIVDAVGISVNASSDLLKPIVPLIQKAMSDAVMGSYAAGRKDPAFVKARMFEARKNLIKRLI